MPPWAIRVLAFVLSCVALSHSPTATVVLWWATSCWTVGVYPNLIDMRRQRGELESMLAVLREFLELAEAKLEEFVKLEASLKEAQRRIRALEQELERARSARPDTSADDQLYRRVGLSPGAPGFLLAAARRAYRRELHPDAHPEPRKAAAHQRFVEAEEVFRQILKLRGL